MGLKHPATFSASVIYEICFYSLAAVLITVGEETPVDIGKKTQPDQLMETVY